MLQEILKAIQYRVLRSDLVFQRFLFPRVVAEWNNLDINIQYSFAIHAF